jgi:hypothetical protein
MEPILWRGSITKNPLRWNTLLHLQVDGMNDRADTHSAMTNTRATNFRNAREQSGLYQRIAIALAT